MSPPILYECFFRLGNAAIFLIGGQDRDQEPSAILLRSGDVVIMAGPVCRRAYHGRFMTFNEMRWHAPEGSVLSGVPRILENTIPHHLMECNKPSGDWKPYAQFLQKARININVRQVFPKGFKPTFVDETFS